MARLDKKLARDAHRARLLFRKSHHPRTQKRGAAQAKAWALAVAR